ncbi:MAG: hypothetical protein FWD83_08330 [Promicromonosporaceae bacterium]|nr:hypothetical protein [Promicromonosporaceae bacterium]
MQVRQVIMVATTVFGLLAVSGCSAEPAMSPIDESEPTAAVHAGTEGIENPWAAEIAAAYAAATSDFIREILADGTLERHEHREAKYRYTTCLAEGGIPVFWQEWADGYGTGISDDDIDFDFMAPGPWEVMRECENKWIGEIDMLWYLQETNPHNLDDATRYDALAECLVRHGFAPQGFTGREYLEILERYDETIPWYELEERMAGFTQDERGEYLRNLATRYIFPDGTELWFGDDQVRSCQWNPTADLID